MQGDLVLKIDSVTRVFSLSPQLILVLYLVLYTLDLAFVVILIP